MANALSSQRVRFRPEGHENGLDRYSPRIHWPSIADLSPEQIAEMSLGEMIRVIQEADPPFLNQSPKESSRCLQAASLEQLVYLAKRHCRRHAR